MSWQIVRLEDAAPSPWRNGGGVTRELLVWPPHASAQDWVWRMSVAEVEASGPFSRFDGVQRWFAVLGGAGVWLTLDTPVGAQTHALTRSSAPLCFDGATPTQCDLLNGPTQDFNLMLRSGQATGRMQRVAGAFTVTTVAPKIIAVYALSTGASVLFEHEVLTIPPHSLAWRAIPAGGQLRIEAAEALCMEIAL